MAKILITGGSGFVGRAVTSALQAQGHEVRWLSRKGSLQGNVKIFEWDIEAHTMDARALDGVTGIIHLAGAGIADKRWTGAYKKTIITSRVKSAALLHDYVQAHGASVKTLVGASAVGYYGCGIDERPRREEDAPGSDFLADVCVMWEKSYRPFQESGRRAVMIRTAVVLGNGGGAYPKLAPLARRGLASPLGSGRQAFPWIHIDDLARLYADAVTDDRFFGPYNAVATETVNNREFTNALSRSFGRSVWLPAVPEFVLRLALGESASALCGGVPVSNERLQGTRFAFRFAFLEPALRDLVNSAR